MTSDVNNVAIETYFQLSISIQNIFLTIFEHNLLLIRYIEYQYCTWIIYLSDLVIFDAHVSFSNSRRAILSAYVLCVSIISCVFIDCEEILVKILKYEIMHEKCLFYVFPLRIGDFDIYFIFFTLIIKTDIGHLFY